MLDTESITVWIEAHVGAVSNDKTEANEEQFFHGLFLSVKKWGGVRKHECNQHQVGDDQEKNLVSHLDLRNCTTFARLADGGGTPDMLVSEE